MILLLNYHKVLSHPEARPEFYSVVAEQLEHHLTLLQENGFNFLTPEVLLNWEEAPSAGTPLAAGILKSPTSRGETPAILRPIAAAEQNAPARGQAGCLLSFDDGTLDHLHVVLPVLERFNARALFFIPTSKLNRSGYLAKQDIGVISRAGHTIGSHSHEHRRLDQFPEEDIRVQIELSRQILAEILGASPVCFAPPGGFITPVIRRVAIECGMRMIRTMRWGYNRRFNPTSLECIPLNSYTKEIEFQNILQGRNKPLIYATKQALKNLVPSRVYESFRTGVISLLGRN